MIKSNKKIISFVLGGIMALSGLMASSQAMAECPFLKVPCYQWIEEFQKYDCACKYFYCRAPYKSGVCPLPPNASLIDDNGVIVLDDFLGQLDAWHDIKQDNSGS